MIVRWRVNVVKYKIFMSVIALIVIISLTRIFEFLSSAPTNHVFREPIDVVYTWVNGSDPKFLSDLNKYLRNNSTFNGDYSAQRFDDKYELKFSLRSLEKYAPWVNHVYIVTNGQIPYWLDLDYEKVTLVSHDEIFRDRHDLPSFSSPAIESHLHRIPGLSKYFIYFNDDIFLGAAVYPEDFVSLSKGFLVYFAYPLPECAGDCPWLYVADGQCDSACFNANCQYDGGDCDDLKKISKWGAMSQYYSANKPVSSPLTANKPKRTRPRNLTSFLENFKPKNTSVFNLTKEIHKHNLHVMLQDKLARRKSATRNSSTPIRRPSPVDAYGASLQHTNRVLNLKYGFSPRYVPAHAPVFLDVDIVRRLTKAFRAEFAHTSRNRWRSADDMQFSFAYYYFLVHEREVRDVGEVFDEFDTDQSGTWSDREIRTVLTRLYELPLSYAAVDRFEYLLTNCSESERFAAVPTPEFERYVDSKLPTISRELVVNCPLLRDVLLVHFANVSRYKHHVIKNAHASFVTFKMLRSNVTDVVGHLDEIRQNPKKFVCLNDNLDELQGSENELVKALLYDFYLSFFPKTSKFELSPMYRNKFLYVEELRTWKHNHRRVKLLVYLFVVILLYVTLASVCKRRCVFSVFNKVFCL